jgi:hypothetical protein
MLPEEKGRFCSSCSKTVVDFSLMSDKEVLAYLGGAGGHTCGRFTSDQLNRNLMPPPARKMGWPAFWQLALATLLVSARAEAQMGKPKLVVHQTDKQPKPDTQKPGRSPLRVETMGLVYRIPDPETRFVVVSVIDSSTQQPVPYASIRMDDTHGLSADDLGRFRLTPQMLKAAREIKVSSVGYISQTVTLDGQALDTKILMVKMSAITLGEAVAVRTKTIFNSFLDTARNWLADTLAIPALKCQTVTLYPNPAPRGTTIRVVMRPLPAGNYGLALYNSAGARIQERVVELGGKDQVELWNIPSSLASGLYFVELCTPGLKRIYTGKLMVE